MANTIGGLGEYARRSTVKVTIVPGTSAIGDRRRARSGSGGSCGAPVSGSRRPTKPNFQSLAAAGGRRRHARRLGAAGRLDREHAPPREELAVRHRRAGRDLVRDRRARGRNDAIASVVRNRSTSAPSASTTSAITCPGSAASSAAVSSSAGMGGAGVADVAPRSSTSASFGDAEPAGERARPRARACR